MEGDKNHKVTSVKQKIDLSEKKNQERFWKD